jgi:hypothetical protein
VAKLWYVMKPLQLLYGILGAFNGLLIVEIAIKELTVLGIGWAIGLGVIGGVVAGFLAMKCYPEAETVLRT